MNGCGLKWCKVGIAKTGPRPMRKKMDAPSLSFELRRVQLRASSQHKHVAVSESYDAFGDRAEQQVGNSVTTMRRDDDQVGILFFRNGDNLLASVTKRHIDAHARDLVFFQRRLNLLFTRCHVHDVPAEAWVARYDRWQNVDDAQVGGIVDQRHTKTNGVKRGLGEIERHNHAFLVKPIHVLRCVHMTRDPTLAG